MPVHVSVDQRPAILLLGIGHWSKLGWDYHATDFDDMLCLRRREMGACLAIQSGSGAKAAAGPAGRRRPGITFLAGRYRDGATRRLLPTSGANVNHRAGS